MKTASKLFFALVVILTLFLVSCTGVSPSGDPTVTTAPEGSFAVTVSVYFQNAESGEYELKNEGVEFLPEGQILRYSPEEYDYYDLDTARSTLSASKEGDAITVYYTCETCTVRFFVGEATVSEGACEQTLRKGQIPTPPTLFLKGYSVAGYGKEIAPVYEDTDYTVIFEKTAYTLSLYATKDTLLPDGFTESDAQDGCFVTHYTFEDKISLPTPKSEGYTFLCWNTRPDGSGEVVSEIASGTYQSTSLYAIYTVKLYSISFGEVEGVGYPDYYLPYGTKIEAPIIAPENQKAGYGLFWYTDKSYSALYDFDVMPAENITLCGRWELDTGEGMLALTKEDFTRGTIDSLEELTLLLDYVRYHNLTEALVVEISYVDKDRLSDELTRAQELAEFRASGSISYGVTTGGLKNPSAKCALSIAVKSSFRGNEAIKTAASEGKTAYPYLSATVTPRGENYTAFYIDRLTKTYAVSTTNQLLYVVEHGYRPICEKDSPAERVYLEAKRILNSILPEDATALEKAELIFNYLITAIEYDDKAVEIAESDPIAWPEYDAFYLEGVILQKKAVCDGIASAYSLFCNIEGIPCVKILGPGHAWNRIKLGNFWYVVDATFGNQQISGTKNSIADHAHFLISDAEKKALGNVGENYLNIKAEKSYDYYAKKSLTYQNKTFDYEINSVEELSRLLEYLTSLEKDLSGKTVNFYYKINGMTVKDAYSRAQTTLRMRGIRFNYGLTYFMSGSYGVCKIVFK